VSRTGVRDDASAREFCSGAFAVEDAVADSGVVTLDNHDSHPSIRSMVDDGYDIITFERSRRHSPFQIGIRTGVALIPSRSQVRAETRPSPSYRQRTRSQTRRVGSAHGGRLHLVTSGVGMLWVKAPGSCLVKDEERGVVIF